jgi:hypothetical protein
MLEEFGKLIDEKLRGKFDERASLHKEVLEEVMEAKMMSLWNNATDTFLKTLKSSYDDQSSNRSATPSRR